MKLTLIHKAKKQQLEELVDLSCRTHLVWIYEKVHDVKYVILQVCKRNQLSYNIQIGSLCAHVAKHYSPDRMRYGYSDLMTAEKLISKFHLAFQLRKIGQPERYLNSFDRLVNYGRLCIVLTMKADFKQSILNIFQFNEKLKSIVKRLLSSLFFQFIPSSYSDLLLKLYLQDFVGQEQRNWIEANKYRYWEIYPYHDFFQILISLSYHILNTRKAINSEHFLQILGNPSSGTVEWPMVLGVRNLHKLPLPYE